MLVETGCASFSLIKSPGVLDFRGFLVIKQLSIQVAVNWRAGKMLLVWELVC